MRSGSLVPFPAGPGTRVGGSPHLNSNSQNSHFPFIKSDSYLQADLLWL